MSEGAKTGWMARLRKGLAPSSDKVKTGIGAIFTGRKLDDAALQEVEDVLITADMGPATAMALTEGLRKTRFGQDVSPEDVRSVLADEIASLLLPVAVPFEVDAALKPHVVLVVGVNGAGKTTTIGKLGKQLKDSGKTLMLAAGDTFRAAAVEQIKIWGERIGAEVMARETGADAAGLAFDAMAKAKADGADVLLIDTAGRLHNRADLMSELEKIIRVIRKQDQTAPHSVLLVLDATTGQNAVAQVQTFKEMVNVTGLVVTKLDGSARGGVIVSLAEKFGLPVHAVGVGESIEDLKPFDARAFARGLMGFEE